MTAGTTQSVVLQVYDQYGNKITSGGEAAKIVGTLSPDIPGQNSIGTSDNLDGRYTVNYIIRQATTYTLSVAADAVVLPPFPMSIVVNPGMHTSLQRARANRFEESANEGANGGRRSLIGGGGAQNRRDLGRQEHPRLRQLAELPRWLAIYLPDHGVRPVWQRCAVHERHLPGDRAAHDGHDADTVEQRFVVACAPLSSLWTLAHHGPLPDHAGLCVLRGPRGEPGLGLYRTAIVMNQTGTFVLSVVLDVLAVGQHTYQTFPGMARAHCRQSRPRAPFPSARLICGAARRHRLRRHGRPANQRLCRTVRAP